MPSRSWWRLWIGVAAVVATSIWILPAAANPGAGSTGTPTTISVLYSRPSPLFGVVAAGGRLFTTTDFSHFRAVATPVLPIENGAIGRAWGAFPTESDGWLVTADGDGSAGYLWHTTDGAASWQLVRQVWLGEAGVGRVLFLNEQTGWLLSGNPAESSGLALTATTDGGATWQTVESRVFASTPPDFSSPAEGFRVSTAVSPRPHSKLSAKTPVYVTSHLEITTDGGRSWRREPLAVPTRGTVVVNLPVFFSRTGIEALVDIDRDRAGRGPVTVMFDLSTDGGTVWHRSPSEVPAGIGLVEPQRTLPRPSVSIATSRSWWVLSVGSSGRLVLERTADGGARWVRPTEIGLHAPPGQGSVTADVRAVSASIAFAWVSRGSVTDGYVTYDGGSKWERQSKLRLGVDVDAP